MLYIIFVRNSTRCHPALHNIGHTRMTHEAKTRLQLPRQATLAGYKAPGSNIYSQIGDLVRCQTVLSPATQCTARGFGRMPVAAPESYVSSRAQVRNWKAKRRAV